MHFRLLVATLAALALPQRAAAQGPSLELAATRLQLGVSAPVTGSPVIFGRNLLSFTHSLAPKRRDYTVIGLVVGAGLGFAVGWAFYDTICEAVDNECSDSRVPHLVLGTAAGGSLGALIGSLAD